MADSTPGLFFTGTDTGVGKTYVAALVARSLAAEGCRVGVYKPMASGCRREGDELVCDDAVALWEAAGRPGTLEAVCPQRFEAPLAPHLAARAEGRQLDEDLVGEGLEFWKQRSDILLVEGAGGLMSPAGEERYVADLAADFGYPLVVVARNTLGVINQTLQTLIAAAAFADGIPTAGVVLNDPDPQQADASAATNRQQLEARCVPPILAHVRWGAASLDEQVPWRRLAGTPADLATPDPSEASPSTNYACTSKARRFRETP
jgi:dethiobiotin synthetase